MDCDQGFKKNTGKRLQMKMVELDHSLPPIDNIQTTPMPPPPSLLRMRWCEIVVPTMTTSLPPPYDQAMLAVVSPFYPQLTSQFRLRDNHLSGAELVHGSPCVLEPAVFAESQLSYGRRNLQLHSDNG